MSKSSIVFPDLAPPVVETLAGPMPMYRMARRVGILPVIAVVARTAAMALRRRLLLIKKTL